MAPRLFVSLAVFSLCAGILQADDFKTLRKEYEDAKTRVGGAPKDRAGKVEKNVAPILKKIGDLGTNEAIGFLLNELKTAVPEIGAACAAPILGSSLENAPRLLLQAFSEKNKLVAIGILEAFAHTEKDLAAVESDLVRASQGVSDPDVRKHLPPVLGTLDSVPAIKALFSHVQAAKTEKEENAAAVYSDAVFRAFKATKSEAVKKWLSKDAFRSAGAEPAKLTLAARLAGELKLTEARSELEKLTSHASPEVSGAAVASLSQVGLGGSAKDIAEALEKRKGKEDAGFKIQALDSLALSNTDEALDVVLRSATGNDPEMRAIAMGSLALFKEKPRALEALYKGLEDSDASVRATALRALAGKRDKGMIGPLIEILGREKEERLKVQAGELLARLTGQGQIGLVHEDWKKWWEVTEPKFEFPKEGEKATTNVRAQGLSYFGIEVSSKRVGFVVDISSSMLETVPVKIGGKPEESEDDGKPAGKTRVRGGSGGGGPKGPVKEGKAQKIEVLKKELSRLIRKLPNDMQINIVTFSANFSAWQKELQPLAGPGRQKAVSFVEGLKTGSGTNVFDSLEAALKDRRVDTIYLLTDGMPTAGRIRDQAGICREIQAQNRLRGVTIHCIAFGEKSPLLEQLAKENGGSYRFVDSY